MAKDNPFNLFNNDSTQSSSFQARQQTQQDMFKSVHDLLDSMKDLSKANQDFGEVVKLIKDTVKKLQASEITLGNTKANLDALKTKFPNPTVGQLALIQRQEKAYNRIELQTQQYSAKLSGLMGAWDKLKNDRDSLKKQQEIYRQNITD